jgi:hypothetical protein
VGLSAQQNDRPVVFLVTERFGDLQSGLTGTDDDVRSLHAAQINGVRRETRL